MNMLLAPAIKNKISFLLVVLVINLPLFAQQDTLQLDSLPYKALEQKMETSFYSGDFQEALAIAKKMLAIAETNWGINSEYYGDNLDNIGIVLHHIGELTLAHVYLEAGVEHAKKNQPDQPAIEALRLNNLGMLLKDMGKLGQAVYCLQRSFDLGKEEWAEDSPEYGTVIHNLSILYTSTNQAKKALDYAYQSLSSTEKAVGKTHVKYAFRLANIANILDNSNKSEDALIIYPEVLSVLKAAGHEQHLLYAITLRNMGRSYNTLGDYEAGLPLLKQASERILDKYGDTHPQYIRVLSSLGWAQYKLEQYTEAETSFSTAYTLYQTHGKLDNSNHFLLLSRLGSFYENRNKLQIAAEYYQLLATEMDRIIQYELYQFNEWEQSSWIKKLANKKNAFLSFVHRHPEIQELKETALDLSLSFKQLTLGYRRSLHANILQSEDTLLLNTFAAWQTEHAALGKLLSLPKNKQPKDLDQKQSEVFLLERKLASLSHDFTIAQKQLGGWRDVQQKLATKSVALDFFAFQYIKEDLILSDSVYYGVWLIPSGNNPPQLVSLFEERAVGNIRRIRQLYASTSTGEQQNWQQLIWEPLQVPLRNTETIYYATDGILQLVNIGAIPTTDNRIIANQFSLYQLSDLKYLGTPQVSDAPIAKRALIFGGLNYDSIDQPIDNTPPQTASVYEETEAFSSFRSWTGRDWDYLNWTKEEARATSSYLKNEDWQVHLRMNSQGTEAAFKEACSLEPSPRLLHLATHAFYFAKPKEDDTEIGFKVASDPLLRAGLILSNANVAWQGELTNTEAEDGILTAYEIAQLQLQQTELVVLSACNTGQGAVVGNEGVYGLQRAFKAAGVKYILMSLWSVDDRKTYEFMNFFYQFWQTEGKDIPAAYQAAQQVMQGQYATPFDPMAWAGFILIE